MPARDGVEHAPDDELSPEGDPVCWVDRVCDRCGGIEDGPPSPTCPRCDTPRPEH